MKILSNAIILTFFVGAMLFARTMQDDKRAERNALLAKTDFYALSDVTMSDAIKTYRQELRDLPAHEDWPDVDFPTKPEE